MTTRIGSAALNAARTGAVWASLGPAAAVSLSGPDARRFCNGMWTANVRDLPVGGTARSALVDDRGLLFGLLDVVCTGADAFLALLDGIDAATFVERFRTYVVFDDVTMADESARYVRFTAQGPAVERPPAGTAAEHQGGFVLTSRRSPASGVDHLVPAGRTPALDGLEVTASDIEVLRVLAGRVAFPADTGDKGLPHELGLRDEVLSFDKGCYIGQEAINRIDVMGQVRRALAGVHVRGEVDGGEVGAGGAVAGRLTSPVGLPDGTTFGLAVLRKPSDTPGTPVVVGGVPAVVVALPFEG
jgi:folate-binding protein YgfZ